MQQEKMDSDPKNKGNCPNNIKIGPSLTQLFCFQSMLPQHKFPKFQRSLLYLQARIAQLVAYPLGTGELLGSNPGKGENFSMKI